MSYRNTKLNQDDFLMWSSLVQKRLEENKGNFSAFDGHYFTTDFVAAFKQSLQTAYETLKNKTAESVQMQYTQKVAALMSESRTAYHKCKHFLTIFFKQNPIYTENGLSKSYQAAVKSTDKMLIFLLNIYEIGEKHKDNLAVIGYTINDLEELKALHNSLLEAIVAQKIARQNKIAATHQRTEAYNKVYEFVHKTCRAAKLIFANNSALYKEFLIPTQKGNPTTDASVSTISVKNQAIEDHQPIKKSPNATIKRHINKPLILKKIENKRIKPIKSDSKQDKNSIQKPFFTPQSGFT